MAQFTHLHVHSHYSILDGMSKVTDLVDKCLKNGMYAMALTDHGNMFGIKEFTDYANKVNGKKKDKIKELEGILANDGASAEEKQEAQAKLDAEKAIPFFTPIIGTEAYVARRSHKDHDPSVKDVNFEGKEFSVDKSGNHLIILAKNKVGYQNLCKLATIAYVDGLYARPRIDHQLLEEHHEGLIVCSACIAGEVPQKLLKGDYAGALETVKWFQSIFGEDYYLEIQRHKTDKPNADTHVYEVEESYIPDIIRLSKETGVKIVCTNDVHFVEEEHGEAHDRLVCLSTGADFNDPKRLHYTKQEWLKTPDEMAAIFADIPEALENTMEIAAKVETYSIESGPIMPKFAIPEEFGTEDDYRQKFTEEMIYDEFTQDENGNVIMSREDGEKKIKRLGGYEKLFRIKLEGDYLAKLAWEGAHWRYGEVLSDDVKERINFELYIMKTMGFPGYFLIVRDYIRAAREELGVSVGPGRGSAAGSAVAYCLRITDIDPIKYDLLFERFLNPDRISLPDIDVDFDDAGRGKVLQWVTKKYGAETVAHIITYGTMATKSSIKDVCRVEQVPLGEVNRLCGLVPDKFDDSLADPKTGKVPKVNLKNCFKYIPELADAHDNGDVVVQRSLTYASQLENTNRQIGIHACGFIIGADDLKKFAPLCTIKDKETGENVQVTQYDGHVIESVGLIKMDFLGLSTLSIIKEALANIKHSKGEDVDIDHIPIDDALTYELYSRGDTIGTFQFESPGMQKFLRELHPTVFEDIIAMNALYRPGPMQYIPTFIDRKLGKEPITYDIPCMEKYLKDTYGVTVYQEQVMLLSRQLANFTRGESDKLRKAMGKKQMAILEQLKGKFISGGTKNGHDEKVLNKIWSDWEEFAKYAFNKSHATCYSWVAYQTAYLKAHYPAELMAANLTSNKSDITKVTKFMEECKRMKVEVLGPDVNESELNFSVNKAGAIRFGMAGVKGLGESAVDAIIKERELNGKFKDIFDLVERVPSSSLNRKALESLALSGAFDSFEGFKREFMFVAGPKGTFAEELSRYGSKVQSEKSSDLMGNLFADLADDTGVKIPHPQFPKSVDPWPTLERLNKEKELVGIYLSAHPLDDYKVALKYLVNTHMTDFDLSPEEVKALYSRQISCGGLVTNVREGMTKKNTPYAIVTVEDYEGSHEFALFGDDYMNLAGKFHKNVAVYIQGAFKPRFRYSKPDDPLEFKIGDVKLLSSVKDQLAKKLTVTISEEKVDQMFINEFLPLVQENAGEVLLYLRVHEQSTGKVVPLFARKCKVNASNEFVGRLQQMADDGLLTFQLSS
ncbi:MAG: DNA polymerase III subunit alpha [Paludibacteraceae bacterium]|nr:DNA polymerase III subunit alpha [Paludibacteraceae bacterium]